MATELSVPARVAQHLEAGEYAEAIHAIVREWNDRSEFGVRHCPMDGHTDRWVKFKTSGYPFGLRRKWDAARSDTETLSLILPYVIEWNLVNLDGQPISLPDGARPTDLLDDVEDQVLMWLIREFVVFWLGELLQPRKNS